MCFRLRGTKSQYLHVHATYISQKIQVSKLRVCLKNQHPSHHSWGQQCTSLLFPILPFGLQVLERFGKFTLPNLAKDMPCNPVPTQPFQVQIANDVVTNLPLKLIPHLAQLLGLSLNPTSLCQGLSFGLVRRERGE